MHFDFFLSELRDDEVETIREKLKLMKTEYEDYKEIWGLNIYYSLSAGAAQNFSEYESCDRYFNSFLAAKKSSELQLVHIFFDSSTFDRVERDVKVICPILIFSFIFFTR